MRILLIAPEQPQLNAVPEIRTISSQHHVTVLNGTVTIADVYQACRMSTYQIIHFATHGNDDGIFLSGEQMMGVNDIGQAARISHTDCVFSNTCLGSRLAAYLVQHGVRYVIYSTSNILDDEAWKMPAAFYDALQNGHGQDIVGAFLVADNAAGQYGLNVSPAYLQDISQHYAALSNRQRDAIVITLRQLLTLSLVLSGLLGALTIVIYLLAGVIP